MNKIYAILSLIIPLNLICQHYLLNKKIRNLEKAIKDNNISKIYNIINKDNNIINLKDNFGLTPLMYCIKNKRLDILEKLIEKYNPDINIENGREYKYIEYHIDSDISDIHVLNNSLVNKIKITQKHKKNKEFKFTIIHYLIAQGYYKLLHNLINRKNIYSNIDLYQLNNEKQTYLIFSIINNRNNIAKDIINNIESYNIPKSRYINHKDQNGLSALHWCAKLNMNDIADMLISNGADYNINDNNQDTPLFHAIRSYNLIFIKNILKKDIDINHQNNNGDTALIIAAKKELNHIIAQLIERYIDINITNKKMHNALTYTIKNNDIKAFKLLIENGIKRDKTNIFKYNTYLSRKLKKLIKIFNRFMLQTKNMLKNNNKYDLINNSIIEDNLIDQILSFNVNFLPFLFNNLNPEYIDEFKIFLNDIKSNNRIKNNNEIKDSINNIYYKIVDLKEKKIPFNISNNFIDIDIITFK
jgi:ankyrin repeat protein